MSETLHSPSGAPISPVKLAHVVLRSKSYQASIDWWLNLLGAHVQFSSPFLCFLTYDEEHHRLAIINAPDSQDANPAAAGVDHFAFSYGDLDSLLASYQRLKAGGVTPYWCINHGPTTSLYYRDPDNNQVELQVDNFQTGEETAAWFHSEAFRRNPIGVAFDPDVMVERRRAGTPVAMLLEQEAAGQ